jgi:prepilin-type N-terminal cleavage/methylation domain-containing protein
MKARSGFTLIEMLVAVALSSIVMVGLIDITASMLERHFEGIRHGKIDSETLYSLEQMRLELEAATYYSYPNTASPSGMSIQGCGDYFSATSPGTQIPAPGATISSFAYCLENHCTGSNPDLCDPSGYTGPYDLVRYSNTGCPTSCKSGSPQTLIYQNVYLEPGFPNPFYLNPQFGGVDLHMVVGYPVATAVEQTPTYYQIDTTYIPDTGRMQ